MNNNIEINKLYEEYRKLNLFGLGVEAAECMQKINKLEYEIRKNIETKINKKISVNS